MINEKQINKILEDHEERLSALEGKAKVQKKENTSAWYRSNSTIEKIIFLIQKGFFKEPRKIGDIVSELKTKDYHLESSDLTLPLRKIVRNDLLRKTKKFSDGSKSKAWLYIENKE